MRGVLNVVVLVVVLALAAFGTVVVTCKAHGITLKQWWDA